MSLNISPEVLQLETEVRKELVLSASNQYSKGPNMYTVHTQKSQSSTSVTYKYALWCENIVSTAIEKSGKSPDITQQHTRRQKW